MAMQWLKKKRVELASKKMGKFVAFLVFFFATHYHMFAAPQVIIILSINGILYDIGASMRQLSMLRSVDPTALIPDEYKSGMVVICRTVWLLKSRRFISTRETLAPIKLF